jgi:hypothetical protein
MTVRVGGEAFRLVKVPGDGSCFFHAVLVALSQGQFADATPETVGQLRRMVSDYHATHKRPQQSRDILEPTTFACHDDVQATACQLNLRIMVWEGVNNMWVEFSPMHAPPQTICLYNPSNVHFDTLLRDRPATGD